jgi:hypothetical protein
MGKNIFSFLFLFFATALVASSNVVDSVGNPSYIDSLPLKKKIIHPSSEVVISDFYVEKNARLKDISINFDRDYLSYIGGLLRFG